MVAPHPDSIDSAQLAQDAWDYCITPLLPVEDIRAGGLHLYKSGEGVRLTDFDGNVYLDMMCSHTRANSLGYGNDEIADAVYEQLSTLHYVGTVANFAEPTIHLAKTDRRNSARATFPGCSSSAAARRRSRRRSRSPSNTSPGGSKPRAHKIISRWNAYHGATMGAMGATDWLGTRHISEPGVPGYSFIPGPMNYRNPFGMDEEEYADFCADLSRAADPA